MRRVVRDRRETPRLGADPLGEDCRRSAGFGAKWSLLVKQGPTNRDRNMPRRMADCYRAIDSPVLRLEARGSSSIALNSFSGGRVEGRRLSRDRLGLSMQRYSETRSVLSTSAVSLRNIVTVSTISVEFIVSRSVSNFILSLSLSAPWQLQFPLRSAS